MALFLARVSDVYARKLAKMWHGMFRVVELCEDHAVRLETAGTLYRLFPVMHVSKLERVVNFSDRQISTLMVNNNSRVDIDESLSPEDSSVINLYADGC